MSLISILWGRFILQNRPVHSFWS